MNWHKGLALHSGNVLPSWGEAGQIGLKEIIQENKMVQQIPSSCFAVENIIIAVSNGSVKPWLGMISIGETDFIHL